MKFLNGLILNNEILTPAYDAKVKEMQSKGLIGQDVDTEIEGHQVKLYLMPSVWEQYEAVTVAETFLQVSLFTEDKSLLELKKKLWLMVKKHSLIDGVDGLKVDDNTLSIIFIEQAIACYLLELLLPLYQRSCTSLKDYMTVSLKGYIKEPQKELV